jgi:hypothetical protein
MIRLRDILTETATPSYDAVITNYIDWAKKKYTKLSDHDLSSYIAAFDTALRNQLGKRRQSLISAEARKDVDGVAATWRQILVDSVKDVVKNEIGMATRFMIRNFASREDLSRDLTQYGREVIRGFYADVNQRYKESATYAQLSRKLNGTVVSILPELETFTLNHIY